MSRKPKGSELARFSLFSNVRRTKPSEQVLLCNFIESIRSGTWKDEVASCREQFESAGEKAYKEARRNLAAVSLSASVKFRGAKATLEEQGAVHSGLLHLDFDGKDNPGMSVAQIREIVQDSPHVIACFLSPSGRGVKGIALVPANLGSHAGCWEAARQEFEEVGLILDPSTKNVLGLCYVSHDPDVYQYPDAVEIQPVEVSGRDTIQGPTMEGRKGTVRLEFAREVLREFADRLGRPDRADWLKISSAVFEGVGVEEGCILLREAFPEEDGDSYEDLARSFSFFAPWDTLRAFGVNTTDPEALLEDMPTWPSEESASGFPSVISGAALMHHFPEPPPDVIRGIVGKGEKLLLAATSKAGKTFAQLNLAAAVANGGKWFGFECVQGEVLFVNFEISEPRMSQRLKQIEGAGRIHFWNLRGHKVTWQELRKELKRLDREYSLIIIDPIYKMLHGANENDNGEIAEMLHDLEVVAKEMGATVAFTHHFSKGGKANVAQQDRASGAGVWARDPDAILTLTDHEAEGCFTLEGTLRNYKAPEKSVWRFTFPTFTLVDGADPNAIRGGSRNDKKGGPNDVLEILADGPLTKKEMVAALVARLGCSDRTAERRIQEADSFLTKLEDGRFAPLLDNSDS